MQEKQYTIFPESRFKTTWDIISCMLIIHQCITIPLQITFQDFQPGYLPIFDIICDLWFILDLVLSFNTGYKEKGILHMERKQIIVNYMKGWFIFDLASSIPYSWIIYSD